MYVTLSPAAWNLQRKVHLASVAENVQTKLLDEVSHQVSDHSMSVSDRDNCYPLSQSLPKRAGGGLGGGRAFREPTTVGTMEAHLGGFIEGNHDDRVT